MSRGPSARPLRRGARCALARGDAAVAAALLAGLALACTPPGDLPPPAPPAPAAEAAPGPRSPAELRGPHRALWVLAEGARRVLDHPDRIPELIEDARGLGATDLFVQVYRAGRAWYDSSIADASPYREVRDSTGVDSLALLLDRAHAAGLRVHAWVNVLSLAHNTAAPILQRLGRAAVLADREGRSLLDYPDFDVPEPDRRYYRMGTPGLYLDPAAPGVAEELTATCVELLERYPALDGLHLDYIRYPDVLPFVPGSRFGVGLDFGYGEASRARFERETGRRAPLGRSLANANAWDDWRRERVTALVGEVARAARLTRPGVTLSAAVWADADRAYLALSQDWRRWLQDGSLDFAVAMAYTHDDRLLSYQAQHFAGISDAGRVWVGIGAWLFAETPERAVAQLRLVHAAGVDHIALFSYDSIVSSRGLHDALRAVGAVREPPLPRSEPPRSDARVD